MKTLPLTPAPLSIDARQGVQPATEVRITLPETPKEDKLFLGLLDTKDTDKVWIYL